MSKVEQYPGQRGLYGGSKRNLVAALTLMLFAQAAGSASIAGRAMNTQGEPLAKVSICLAKAESPRVCEKVHWTNKKGSYSFSGLKQGNGYIVAVNRDGSAANRKFEQYANYAWQPGELPVSVESRNEKIRVESFVGKFNFSNFQRIVNLTAADFPELYSIDLSGSYVALKVFLRPETMEEAPQTIFLGQVRSTDAVQIDASVPLTFNSIKYEIFSSNLSFSGSISLVQP